LFVPIHIEGALTPFFYRVSKFRKWLGIKANIEMLWLSDEFFKQRKKQIKITVGKPILASDIDSKLSDNKAAQEIRKIVHSLRK